MKRKYTYQCREVSSYKVFLSFVRYDNSRKCDASEILSKECYHTWLKSRRKQPKKPMEAFRRALTAHCRGVDGRRPFPEDVETSLLKQLRKKQRWACFEAEDQAEEQEAIQTGPTSIATASASVSNAAPTTSEQQLQCQGLIGVQGFPSLGYHEKKRQQKDLDPYQNEPGAEQDEGNDVAVTGSHTGVVNFNWDFEEGETNGIDVKPKIKAQGNNNNSTSRKRPKLGLKETKDFNGAATKSEDSHADVSSRTIRTEGVREQMNIPLPMMNMNFAMPYGPACAYPFQFSMPMLPMGLTMPTMQMPLPAFSVPFNPLFFNRNFAQSDCFSSGGEKCTSGEKSESDSRECTCAHTKSSGAGVASQRNGESRKGEQPSSTTSSIFEQEIDSKKQEQICLEALQQLTQQSPQSDLYKREQVDSKA